MFPVAGSLGAKQAAEKGPSAETHLRWVPPCSRGAATYGLSTPRTSHRAPPCISTFLSSLGEIGFFSILLESHCYALPVSPMIATARIGEPSSPASARGRPTKNTSPRGRRDRLTNPSVTPTPARNNISWTRLYSLGCTDGKSKPSRMTFRGKTGCQATDGVGATGRRIGCR